METIVIYGDRGERRLSDALIKLLDGAKKPFILYRDERFSERLHLRKYAKYLLVDTDNLELVKEIPIHLIVMKNSVQTVRNSQIIGMKGCLVLLSGEGSRARELLSGTGNPVISCGLSSKDTVTFSSISDSVLSIQRGFTDITGQLVEQQDLTTGLRITLENSYEKLAACTAMICLGLKEVLEHCGPGGQRRSAASI